MADRWEDTVEKNLKRLFIGSTLIVLALLPVFVLHQLRILLGDGPFLWACLPILLVWFLLVLGWTRLIGKLRVG